MRLELVRHSLSGTHYRYRQYIGGVPVVGGELTISVRADGAVRSTNRNIARQTAAAHPLVAAGSSLVPLNVGGELRFTRREISTPDGVRQIVRYFDPATGSVLREEPQFANAKAGRVFDPNPVAKLNNPSMQDRNDSANAVPDAAYTTVELLELNDSGPLTGPWARIRDLQLPAVAPADASSALFFDRSEPGFEDVNAWFHIDASQRYLQSLGYRGERAVAAYPLEIDPHASSGADTSYFLAGPERGKGTLLFGDGGTDDAEDSDLVIHEYAHAIHEWISPGTYLGPFGSEGRALSEGFGDYWAFSATYAKTAASGRDPACFADWDARCWENAASEGCVYAPGSDCLRRLDGAKTMADFVVGDSSGTEHRNGEIWSSALREIFLALTGRHGFAEGKRVSDTLVVESLFAPPPNPGYAWAGRGMLEADRLLFAGSDSDVICAAMMRRGILTDCGGPPRGEVTWFQSPSRGVPIPDNDSRGTTLRTFANDTRLIARVTVNVDIRHPVRGDLRLVLTAPDGTEVVLQNPSADKAADLVATYGLDAVPVQSLAVLAGRSARGEWKLLVQDLGVRDAGILVSWSLVIEFEGEQPSSSRPVPAVRHIVPVAGHAPGANGTFFVTDLRLLNATSSEELATLIYTPSGCDGRIEFSAVKVSIPAGQVVSLDDVVGRTLHMSGIGQLEIGGEVVTTGRTWTAAPAGGSAGQFVPAFPSADGMVLGDSPRTLTAVENGTEFRTNIGFAETSGAGGRVRLTLFDAKGGALVGMTDYAVQPHAHLQVPVGAGGSFLATVEVIEGGARILSYASVVDNRTGDAMFIPAEAPDDGWTGYAPAISAPGAEGTFWTTTLWVGSSLPSASRLSFTEASSGARFTDGVALGERQATRIDDVVKAVAPGSESRGLLELKAGAGVVAALRISTPGSGGSFGQRVPFLSPSAGRFELLLVENSDAFRTNVGLFSDVDSTVRLTLFDAAGSQRWSDEFRLAPLRLEQFPLPVPVTGGHISVEVVGGRAASYISVVDNVSGDAITVPAQGVGLP